MSRLITTAAVALALVIAACTPAGNAPSTPGGPASPGAGTVAPSATAAPAEEVELRVFTRWSDASPASQAFRDRLAEFQTLNPNVTIVDESINDEAGFGDKMKAFIANDDMPAIFQNYGGADVAEYIQAGLYADLAGEFEADPEWQSSFVDVFYPWRYDDLPGVYGVPYEFFGVTLFYNEKLLSEVGESVPTTISQLEAASAKLLDAGYVPLAVGEKDTFKGDHLFVALATVKHGGALMRDLATGTTAWNGPEVIEIMSIMADWNAKGYLGENIVGVDYATENAMFLSGKAAMKFDGSWFLSEAEASEIADSINVAPFPHFDDTPAFEGHTFGGAGAGLSVSNKLAGAQREAALQLLQFLTSVEHFTYVQEQSKGGVYPVRMDPSDEIGPVTTDYVSVINEVSLQPLTPGFAPEVTVQFRDSIQGLFAGLSPAEAAQQIAARHDEVSG